MKNKHSRFFEMDDTLRIIFAFYSCMSSNPNWIKKSEYSKHNREIAKELFSIENMADYYFLLQGRFYGFTIEKQDEETIACKMEEYDTFYDLASEFLSIEFSYHIPSKNIVILKPVEKITNKKEKQYQKIA